MDAIVIGAGPNGLVGANLLADEGWKVLVLEEQPAPGGAVKTIEFTEPGFRHDAFSAFYPLAAASPTIQSLELERWGLRWRRSPAVVGHPTREGAALLWQGIDETADGLEAAAPGDGDAWRDLFSVWDRVGDDIVGALLSPFPPMKHGASLALKLRNDALRFARLSLTSVRRMATERFRGPHPGLLLAGNAMHADLTPEMPLSGFFGFLLCGLGQRFGYPAPEGGAGALTDALVARLRDKGGEVVCNSRVDRIEVRDGRAAGVTSADGESHAVDRAVLADVSAVALYRDLVAPEHLPRGLLDDIDRFQYDHGTVKVDWALDRPVPWTHQVLDGAGTVHVVDDLNHLSTALTQLECGTVPDRPPLVVGQMNAVDPTRSPEGTATVWAYAHVPQNVERDVSEVVTGKWDDADKETFADRMEAEIERNAPGFRDTIRSRHVMGPPDLERADRNLVGGAVNGGTAQIYQQLLFRPTPRWGRPETPVAGLYLASASAHPGGGVHGACGANAARAALSESSNRFAIGAGAALGLLALTRRRRGR